MSEKTVKAPSAAELTKKIRELAKNPKNIVYQCCICHKVTDDPCTLGITTNWTKSESKQNYQQFWCHRVCIELVIAPNKLDIS